MPSTPCLCGHPDTTHQHYRPGTDCSLCGYRTCAYYVPATRRARLLHWLGLQ
jgi:hypothetical protein